MGKFEPSSNSWDGVVNGANGDENIFNILDFPMESLEEGDEFIGDWDIASKSQYLGPIPSELLMMHPMVNTGPPALRPPMDANLKAKQVPYKSDDTLLSFILRQNKCSEVGVFQTQSPVSVLETSSAVKIPIIKSNIVKRTRSRRARPTGLSSWHLISPFFATRKAHNSKKNKERRKNLSRLSNPEKTIQDLDSQNSGKKCTHCEVTKTPQWREGPLGPKTLCNACGVRYRSGRLFPEYRPAASPMFVPTQHSNSHKKVIEMRNKGKKQAVKIEEPSISASGVEFVPMSGYLFDPIC